MSPPIRINHSSNDEAGNRTLLYMEGYVLGYKDGINDGWDGCIETLKKLKNEKNDKVIFRKLKENGRKK